MESLFNSVGFLEEEIINLLVHSDLVVTRSRFKSKIIKKEKILDSCLIERGATSLRGISLLCEAFREVKKNNDFLIRMCTGISLTPDFGFKSFLEQDRVCFGHRNVACFANTSRVTGLLEIYNKKFDKMFTKRVFVHWIVGEGIDSGEVSEMR
jgi:hypothetical protein